MLELAIMGFVTAEKVVRLWTRDGCHDRLVTDTDVDGLRDVLGTGRVDREAMVPNAQTEMGILDEESGQLWLAAPYGADEPPPVIAGPFSLTRVDVVSGNDGQRRLDWSDATVAAFVAWVAVTIASQVPKGEDVVVHERDTDGNGRRVASAAYFQQDGELTAMVATNAAPEDDALWAQARKPDGGGVISVPASQTSAEDVAQMLTRVVLGWPGGPLDLVCSWDLAGDR